MKLFRFLSFINEKKKNNLFPFFFSELFHNTIQKIDSDISRSIVDMKFENSEFTMIDISMESNDTITFVPSNRMVDHFSGVTPIDSWKHILVNSTRDSDVWKLSRSEMRIGRFIKKIFGDRFKDSDIEDFVNEWKSIRDERIDRFELWNKNLIERGYDSRNYNFEGASSNSLMNSCMNDQFDLINFYKYCDVELLVMLDEEDMILARALVWTDHKGRKIMDRVYYTYDFYYNKMINWANRSGWYYKTRNLSGGSSFTKNGKTVHLSTKVRIPNVFDMMDDDGFPYMDTFYYAQGTWAMNDEPEDGKYIKLNCTDGGFELHNNLTDVHGDEIIDERDYVMSREQGGYIYRNGSIHIEYSGGQYGGYNYNDWIEDDYLDNPKNGFVKSSIDGKWYKEKHCVWSDFHNDWIYRPDSYFVRHDWVHGDHMVDFYKSNPQYKNPFDKR